MRPEAVQDSIPLFIRRAAALAEMKVDRNLLSRPAEFGRIFYFAPRTPGASWPTDQNGHIREDLKSDLSSLSRVEFLNWLPASLGLLCIDCGSHCYPNCMSAPKKCSRRNRRQRYEQQFSALADPQNQTRFTVAEADRRFVLDMYRPIFAKTRRKRKKRKTGIVIPISLPLEPAA
jgi:hypothetical protein